MYKGATVDSNDTIALLYNVPSDPELYILFPIDGLHESTPLTIHTIIS